MILRGRKIESNLRNPIEEMIRNERATEQYKELITFHNHKLSIKLNKDTMSYGENKIL